MPATWSSPVAREHELGRLLLDLDALGRAGRGDLLHDTLVRGRDHRGRQNFPVPGGMIETAENLRREYHIGRAEQDELALRSHQRAVAAQDAGIFDDEIVPVIVKTRKGTESVDTDEHPRRTPPSNRSPRCARSCSRPTRRRRSRPGTRAVRTTRRPCAWSRTRRRRDGSACGRWPAGVVGGRRRAAADDGHRSGALDGQGPRARRPAADRHRPDRAQRGVRGTGPGVHPRVGAWRARTWTGSMSTDRVSASGTRWAPPVPDPDHLAA